MTSRRHSMRPTTVEVKPDYVLNPSILSPSTPPASPPSKAVRFAETSNQFSRQLTSTEAWSLYHFENHARQCPSCHNPGEVYRRGQRLCDAGHGLAQDVAYHVYHKNGDIYSTKKDENSKLVRVEIPHGYAQLRSLLSAMDHRVRSHRTVPILSYDRSYPVAGRRAYTPDEQLETVTIEPAVSGERRRRRYSTIIPKEDEATETTSRPKPKERRGTLYEKDMQRQKTDYRVEIREPSDVERRERRRRESGQRRNSVWL